MIPSLFILLFIISSPANASNSSLPGCQSTCGNINIPYPFGIGANCSKPGFELTCNSSTNDGTSYKPFLAKLSVEIINISLSAATALIYNHISWQCYNYTTKTINTTAWSLDFTSYPYTFSNTRNRFTTIGCDTLAYISGGDGYQSGCVSVCKSTGGLINGSCSGIGCCQTAIPRGMKFYAVSFDHEFNNSKVWQFNPCSYAVLVDEDWFDFRTTYVTSGMLDETNGGRVPLAVDWAIGDNSCQIAKGEDNYACVSKHSQCMDSSNGNGYLCNCSNGYRGNPYLVHGCQDVDECAMKDEYPCFGVCTNYEGGYSCECPHGTQGDPFIAGSCYDERKLPLRVKLALGIGIGIVILLCLCLVVYVLRERKKVKAIKEMYFQQNGGWILLEELKSQQGIPFKIFTKEELELATNKFDKSYVLGEGGHGTVYKGKLTDDRIVAIKKSMIVNDNQKKEFVREMLILSQINHRNIVKLFGCCLEVEVPMLVYEYISNGTVYEFLHKSKLNIPLDTRLRIVTESSEALAYLHSSASPPIIHGDVKSSNILLDDHYTAKVTDFGASKLVPKDEIQFATLVQGTVGYLDPEYLQTSQLTEKSDVYSFGVVLVEILSGKKAIYFEESGKERSLASSFIVAMKKNRLAEFLEYEVNDEMEMKLIKEVAKVARGCLNVLGEERPTMKEVAEQLYRLRRLKQQSMTHKNDNEITEDHPWSLQNTEETEGLLGSK